MRHLIRQLAHQGLPIRASLAGNHQVGPGNGAVQIGQRRQQIKTALGATAQYAVQAAAQSAGCTGTGQSTDSIRQQRRQVSHTVVQQLYLRRSGAFLGTEHRSGTVLASIRIGHIAGVCKVHTLYAILKIRRDLQPLDPLKIAAGWVGDSSPVSVIKCHAKRCQRTGAAVAHTAAAKADDKMVKTKVYGVF